MGAREHREARESRPFVPTGAHCSTALISFSLRPARVSALGSEARRSIVLPVLSALFQRCLFVSHVGSWVMAALVVSETSEPGSRVGPGRGGCSNAVTSRPRVSGGTLIPRAGGDSFLLETRECHAVKSFELSSPETQGPVFSLGKTKTVSPGSLFSSRQNYALSQLADRPWKSDGIEQI